MTPARGAAPHWRLFRQALVLKDFNYINLLFPEYCPPCLHRDKPRATATSGFPQGPRRGEQREDQPQPCPTKIHRGGQLDQNQETLKGPVWGGITRFQPCPFQDFVQDMHRLALSIESYASEAAKLGYHTRTNLPGNKAQVSGCGIAGQDACFDTVWLPMGTVATTSCTVAAICCNSREQGGNPSQNVQTDGSNRAYDAC